MSKKPLPELQKVSIKEFIKNFTSYRNKRLVINECPFYVNTKSVYDDYYVLFGPLGGASVHFDGGNKKVLLDYYAVSVASAEKGIPDKSYYRNLMLPTISELPPILGEMVKDARRNKQGYEKTLKHATERLNKLETFQSEYPEYIL